MCTLHLGHTRLGYDEWAHIHINAQTPKLSSLVYFVDHVYRQEEEKESSFMLYKRRFF
jgi:hypothetical protein